GRSTDPVLPPGCMRRGSDARGQPRRLRPVPRPETLHPRQTRARPMHGRSRSRARDPSLRKPPRGFRGEQDHVAQCSSRSARRRACSEVLPLPPRAAPLRRLAAGPPPPTPPRLRRGLDAAREATPDVHLLADEVNVAPPQREQLAEPETRLRRRQVERAILLR